MSKKDINFSIEEVTKILLKDKNINSGFFILGLKVNMTAGHMQSPTKEPGPSVLLSIENLRLIEVESDVKGAVDASLID